MIIDIMFLVIGLIMIIGGLSAVGTKKDKTFYLPTAKWGEGKNTSFRNILIVALPIGLIALMILLQSQAFGSRDIWRILVITLVTIVIGFALQKYVINRRK